jgi:hypothetical protein
MHQLHGVSLLMVKPYQTIENGRAYFFIISRRALTHREGGRSRRYCVPAAQINGLVGSQRNELNQDRARQQVWRSSCLGFDSLHATLNTSLE